MWRYVLQEPGIPYENARLVCLDMPNYGGSDHFEKPDTVVLEAISEFIVAMREEHEEAAGPDGKEFNTIIVGHDWGCVVAFRLAAEAPALADRFILSNGPHVGFHHKSCEKHADRKLYRLIWHLPTKIGSFIRQARFSNSSKSLQRRISVA